MKLQRSIPILLLLNISAYVFEVQAYTSSREESNVSASKGATKKALLRHGPVRAGRPQRLERHTKPIIAEMQHRMNDESLSPEVREHARQVHSLLTQMPERK